MTLRLESESLLEIGIRRQWLTGRSVIAALPRDSNHHWVSTGA